MFNNLRHSWQVFKQIRKKEAEASAAQRRLVRMPFDYIAIQQICDSISAGYNVDITVRQKDGTVIEFRKGSNVNEGKFESFADRYTRYHNTGE